MLNAKPNTLSPLPRKKDANYYGIMWDGALFSLAMTISASATVLPAFAQRLGASELVISIMPSLTTVGWLLPQLLSARYVERLRRRRPYIMTMGGIQRSLWLVLAALTFLLGASNPSLLLTLVILVILISSIFDGMATPAWMDFVARVIPARQRGSLFATRTLISGLLGLVGGWITEVTLAQVGFPGNFGRLFVYTSIAFAGSWLVFLRMTNEPDISVPVAAPNLHAYWSNIPTVLRQDKVFRQFMAAMTFLTMGTMALAFFMVAALERLSLSAAYAGQFTIFMTAGQMLTTLFSGRLADTRGHKINLLLGAAFAALAVALPLLAPSLNLFRLAFVLLGFSTALTVTSRLAIVMEYAPEHARATYAGILNTWLAPVTLLAPLLGGWLAQSFGHNAAFTAALMANIVATLLFWLVVKDPRGTSI